MVSVIKGNLFDSKANFIVCPCDNLYDSEYDMPFFHVDKERMKYIKHCSKNNIELLGTAQYVPSEVWALPMVDTLKNNNITAFDNNYQYIVNMFCQNAYDNKIDTKFMKKAFSDILSKAKELNATVAVPKIIGTLANKMIDQSGIDVEVWQ